MVSATGASATLVPGRWKDPPSKENVKKIPTIRRRQAAIAVLSSEGGSSLAGAELRSPNRPARAGAAARPHHMVFLVAVSAIAKNSPNQINVGQGVGRPRRASTYAATANEAKKMASSG